MRFVVVASTEYLPYAAMCTATIEHWHPRANIRLMRVLETKHLVRERLVRWSLMGDEPTVILDADVLVCHPLDAVWREPFDIALVSRGANGCTQPYNMGVMFSRKASFFAEVIAEMDKRLGINDQEALGLAAKRTPNIRVLPGAIWNNSQMDAAKVSREAYLLHYKGDHRKFMADHYWRELWK